MPAFDGGDDFVWIGGPLEGLGVEVGFGDEAVDSGLEVNDRVEGAALEPGRRGRREVEVEPLMAVEPGADFWVLVGGVVVEDDMDGFVRRHFGADGVEEADEFLMAMTLHVEADDGAVEHVERGEQCRGAVALVVVGHGTETSPLHGQSRLSAVERLDLALLVERQDDGMGRRIDVQPDDVAQLGDEVRIVRQLEPLVVVRLQTVGAPDAAHGAGADADGRVL